MKIFVGYDSREDIAYNVCEFSIKSRQPGAEVIPLKQTELREKGLYTRGVDPLSSTEFTFTRFLVPHLMEYKGWAIFVDCDFLCQIDINEVFKQADEQYAVMVVKHKYEPTEGVKMDGQKQLPYPRKNWSSMILWNCGHPSNKKLHPDIVNIETGQYLHRFQWLSDNEIGSLSPEYNWLVGWYKTPENGIPKLIHYTEGGPWFENYRHCEFGAVWERELCNLEKSKISPPVAGPFDFIPPEIESVFKKILKYRVDPANEVYGVTVDEVIEEIKMLDNKKIFAVDGTRDPNDVKGLGWDPYMESFILGCGGQITNYDRVSELTTPVVFRGITKHKHMKACEEKGRDYYYIDTGYFGNVRKKFYHRITKNAMQNLGPIIDRPFDRLEATGWRRRKFRPGRNILLCPPSGKAMACFGLDLDQWMEETVSTIKQYSDRPIIIRLKGSRRDRTSTDTMEMALSQDIHCLVTFNSIAATEALLLGKPAITLGPNAAQPLCKQDLSQIERPYIPTADEVEAWAAHLAYAQFSENEMKDGTAWRILSEPGNIWIPSEK
jgi:hypothetical protein